MKARRRHHQERVYRKWCTILRRWNRSKIEPPDQTNADADQEARCLCNDMPVCSKRCCGNVRRHYGTKTRQEIRAEEAERAARADLQEV